MDRSALESELVSSMMCCPCFNGDELITLTVMIYGGCPFGQGHIGRLPCSIGHYALELV